MSNNKIQSRKKLLEKLAQMAKDEEDDNNFADTIESSNNISDAVDDYVESLIADELSHAFLGDDFDSFN